MKMIIYHYPCSDGFGAAWSAYKAFGDCKKDIEFYPARHGGEIPDVKGKNVYMLDFSYKRDIIEQLARDAKTFIVLDHHKSAEKELAGLHYAHFDMNRSGAGIAWDYFNNSKRPKIIDYTEDRDLWKFELPNSKVVNKYLQSLPFTFEAWDEAAELSVERMVELGAAINTYSEQQLKMILGPGNSSVLVRHFEGFEVPFTNGSTMASEVGNATCSGYPFAVSYFIGSNGEVKVSLRSDKDGIDVSEIAKKYGGGGHRNAAGCLWNLNQLFKVLNESSN